MNAPASRCVCGGEPPKQYVWPVLAAGSVLIAAAIYAGLAGSCPEDESPHAAHAEMYGHAASRSVHWPRIRAEHLRREPACIVCGHAGAGLAVHHIISFRVRPDLELDDGKDGTGTDGNLCTICGPDGRCRAHFWLAHGGNFRGWNPYVRRDAALMRQRWQESERLSKLPNQ